MKKFLSVMLALAVAFTFTFGSTMSAFADSSFEGYTKAEASDIIAQAVAAVESDLKAYEVNYDTAYHDQVNAYGDTLDDITVYEISTANLAKGITDEGALYDDLLADLDAAGNTTIGVKLTGNKTADIALVKGHILATVATGEYLNVAAKASWDDYKAFLTKLVDGIDLSAYTTTTAVTYKVGSDYYDTSAKAAAAEIAAVKKTITDAEYETSASYATLYNDIVESYVGVYEVKNSDETLVTAVKYILDGTDDNSKTLATTTTEANDKTTLEAAQLAAKAALKSAVVTYRTGPNYKVDYDASIAAYEEAMTYLIENYGKDDLNSLVEDENDFAITVNTTKNSAGNYKINGVDYVARCEAAAEYVKSEAKWKSQAAELGIYYDETEAAKTLKAGLIDIYSTGSTLESYAGAYLTASFKASLKIDLSEVKAEANGFYGKVYELATDTNIVSYSKYYYEAEWKTILAAVDTFNAAVDAATDYTAITNAADALDSAIGKVVEADTVDSNVDDYSVDQASDPIAKYFELVKTNSEKTTIYITWDGETYDSSIVKAHVYAWMIEQGARDKASAKALYADACKVIDAYKTLTDLKAAADAVVAMIAALPQKASDVALTDKDAIVAAAKANAAVAPDAKKYVTNVSILNADLVALNKLDAAAINAQIAALPADAKVTVADKEAIQAALDAVEAYNELVADGIYPDDYVNINNIAAKSALETKLEKVKDAELDAIEDAFNTLYVKYVAGTLTAEDTAAVKSLQDAIAAYISNYPADANSDIGESVEFYLAKIAAIVGAEAEDAEWTTTDVKASLFDTSRKLTIWRTSKTSIRVTSVGSVADIKDHGYTVEYKFYKKAPGAASYKLVKTTSSNKYTYTNLKKGTNKFQVKVVVKDADGKVVASKWTYYRAAKVK